MSRSRKKHSEQQASPSAAQVKKAAKKRRPAPIRCAPWLATLLICGSLIAGSVGGAIARRATAVPSAGSPSTRSATSTDNNKDILSSSQSTSVASHASATKASSPAAQPTQQPPADAATRARIEQQFGDLFRAGYAAFQQEQFSAAAKSFEQATQVAPYLPEGHYFLGRTFHSLVLPSKAERCYRDALARDPDFSPAQEKLTVLLYERGAYREAIDVLNRMATKTPEDPFVLGELGINFLALDDAPNARKYLEQYVAIKGSSDAWGQAQLGRAYEALGEEQRAQELFETAIRINPNFGLAYHWLGLLLSRKGETVKSQEAFARYNRLRTLENEEQQLRMVVINNPADVAALVRLAQLRSTLGRQKEAVDTLNRARQVAPSHPGVTQLSREWGL